MFFNSVFLCNSCRSHADLKIFIQLDFSGSQAASSKVSLKDDCCGKETGRTAGVAHLLY